MLRWARLDDVELSPTSRCIIHDDGRRTSSGQSGWCFAAPLRERGPAGRIRLWLEFTVAVSLSLIDAGKPVTFNDISFYSNVTPFPTA